MTPSQCIDRGCSTADCAGLPLRMVRLYDLPGEGPWPYCVECAEVLSRGGNDDCGPFDLIDEAMLDRAVKAMHDYIADDRTSTPCTRPGSRRRGARPR